MTAQINENFFLDGKKLSLAFCPPIPHNHPKIEYLDDDFRNRMSCCWRGYVGTWKIMEDHLYLVDIRGIYQLRENKPLFAHWFTGILRVVHGKIQNYVHQGFESTYEKEMLIEVDKGKVVCISEFKKTPLPLPKNPVLCSSLMP